MSSETILYFLVGLVIGNLIGRWVINKYLK